MKKTKIVIAVSAILAFGRACSRSAEHKRAWICPRLIAALMLMASIPALAQEESGEDQLSNGFKKFSVEEAFEDNGFQWFRDAQLLCAGNKEKSNAMTIGWGGIGTFWQRPALTVYVAEQRYTKKFMDDSEYFTVMSYS